MANPKFTFHMPPVWAKDKKYFSICPECQKDHSSGAEREANPTGIFSFSNNSADIKYDITQHARDEFDEAKWTGASLTREHIARTWRAKVIKWCGQDSGCAQLLLAQDGARLDDWLAERELAAQKVVLRPATAFKPLFRLSAPKRKTNHLENVDEEREQRVEEPNPKRHKTQEVMKSEIKSVPRAEMTTQVLEQVPVAVIPASSSTVVPKGKNHAKNWQVRNSKRKKKEQAAQQAAISEQGAANPREYAVQQQTPNVDPVVTAVGELQQTLENPSSDVSSRDEKPAGLTTLASYVPATPFDLVIRQQKD